VPITTALAILNPSPALRSWSALKKPEFIELVLIMHKFAAMNLAEIGPTTRKNRQKDKTFFLPSFLKSVIFGCRQGA
jgi:hypothetical protein